MDSLNDLTSGQEAESFSEERKCQNEMYLAAKESPMGNTWLSMKYPSGRDRYFFWKEITIDFNQCSSEERQQFLDITVDFKECTNKVEKQLIEQYLDLKALEYSSRRTDAVYKLRKKSQ